MEISFCLHLNGGRHKILLMPRQQCCRGMCKIWLRFDSQELNNNKLLFLFDVDHRWKIVCEMDPG